MYPVEITVGLVVHMALVMEVANKAIVEDIGPTPIMVQDQAMVEGLDQTVEADSPNQITVDHTDLIRVVMEDLHNRTTEGLLDLTAMEFQVDLSQIMEDSISLITTLVVVINKGLL